MYEIPGFSHTLVSAADYRTGNGQFRFVKVAASGKGQQCVAGESAHGVRQNTPNTDEGMTVVCSGIVNVESGAALTPGTFVTSDATGRAIAGTTGQFINGRVLETATAAGQLVAVRLLDGTAKV